MRAQRALSKPCVLVQTIPARSRVTPLSATPLREQPAQTADTRDLYGITARITHIDRVIIRAFLQQRQSALTTDAQSQRAGVEWLPGQTLPREIVPQALPAALEAKLSMLPSGFERVMVGRDVLLVTAAEREIADVMCNAQGEQPRRSAHERRRPLTSIHSGKGSNDAAAKWRLFERDSIL